MTRPRFLVLMMLAATMAISTACSDDDNPVPPPIPPESAIKDLMHRSDVLNNIEYSYNKRDANVYDQLLDVNFTFFYTDGDVNGGGTPVQWGRDVEGQVTTGLFNGADHIDLTLYFHNGVNWFAENAGSETWYFTTVFYNFAIKIGDTTYIPSAGAKAQFTVRNDGTEEKPKWKLVEFRDLGGPSLALAIAASTEPTTWGQVKALYR